jgi:hypothetical protein
MTARSHPRERPPLGEPATDDDEAESRAAPGPAARRLARTHAVGIAAALLLAFLIVFPRWWLLATEPADGERVHINVYGAGSVGLDEALYAALIRDAYDGELPIRDPFLSDDAGVAAQTGSLWQILIGGAGHVLGGIDGSLALATTLATAAALVLFYVLARRIIGSSWATVCAMAIALAALYVVHRSPGFLALRHWDILRPLVTLDPQNELHIWTRYLAPAIPLPMFFGLVLLMPSVAERGGVARIVATGALLALLIYTYLFYWMSFLLALALWACWLWWQRDRPALWRLAAVATVAIFLAAPELALIARNGASLPDDVQARVGAYGGLALHTDWVRAILQRLAIGLPAAWLALRASPRHGFYVALYVAPLLPASTTDWLPQTDHFLFQAWPVFAIPLLLTAGVELARMLPPASKSFARAAFVAAGVAAFAYVAAAQIRGLDAVDDTYAIPSDEHAALRWMAVNLSEDDTVVTPSWISNQLVAALTPASTYLADGFLTRASTDELVDRYLRVSAAFGTNEETTFYRIDPARDVPVSDKTIPADELELHYDTSMAYYLFNEGIRRPQSLTGRFDDWRAQFSALQNAAGILEAHDADYLFCGHRERAWSDAGRPVGVWVTVAFHEGRAQVYRIVPPETPGADRFAGCA